MQFVQSFVIVKSVGSLWVLSFLTFSFLLFSLSNFFGIYKNTKPLWVSSSKTFQFSESYKFFFVGASLFSWWKFFSQKRGFYGFIGGRIVYKFLVLERKSKRFSYFCKRKHKLFFATFTRVLQEYKARYVVV